MQCYINAWKNYAVFKGRASRESYWYFVLFNIIFAVLFSLLDIALSSAVVGLEQTLLGLGMTGGFTTGTTFFYPFYLMAILIPGWAYVARRLHDVGKSGWMQLVVLIPLVGPVWLLVLLLSPSEEGDNKYNLADERQKAYSFGLVKAALIASLVASLYSAAVGIFMNTNISLAMNVLFNFPAALLSVAAGVFMILVFIRSKEEGRTTTAFLAAFVLFWVHFFSRNTRVIQFSLFHASMTKMAAMEWVQTVVGMAATTLLFLLLFAEIRQNGSKKSGILVLLSFAFYLLGIFLVPLLAGMFLNNAPDVVQVMNIAQIMTYLIAVVLLGLVRIPARD